MKFRQFIAALHAALLCLVLAVSPAGSGSMMLLGAGKAGAGAGSCTASSNFLARTSGLSTPERNAYDTMICGLVTDGIITGNLSGTASCGSVLDALYIFATNTTTTANLNLCGTSFGLTGATPPTFTADQGYTGNGTTQFLNTNFSPSTAGGAATLNSTTLGVYTLNNRTTPSTTSVSIGGGDATNTSYICTLFSVNNANTEINAGTVFPSLNLPLSTAQGFTVVSRTTSTLVSLFKNGSAGGSTNADTSAALFSPALFIFANNNNGGGGNQFNSDQISAAVIGAGLNSTQHLALSNRINAYMTALSINVY